MTDPGAGAEQAGQDPSLTPGNSTRFRRSQCTDWLNSATGPSSATCRARTGQEDQLGALGLVLNAAVL
ncbi:hypothetical protein OIE63_39595 (plasmid) [Streptomyces sp. NBC_01795]|uniref:hypothetical protein n=1 Tax=unclassified Streptomyces TaxID=2593676 RepID=UPI002DD8F0B3|nr:MULTISPECIES: hypothetical protein [unclassified Streptomyces]WSA97623.1 hypothetical protein OIE63_39595 [Streptomyces sp. NBC_01795]WSB82127.1 hypothetical protein OHB04_41220 [Streptomyces sp. NBC_01775]WSS18098.1 hypothetical protein OG533_40300 [Streptomyces sp. NBC_01186]